MKSVVVELKDGKAAVLAPDGAVNFIKDENYRVGQLLDINTAPVPVRLADHTRKHVGMIAAAAMAFVIAGSAFAVDTHAASTVTLDVNPSLEYTLNIFDKVIKVEACNDDGESILDLIGDVKGKSIERAVEETLDILEAEDYISADTPAIFTVTGGRHISDRIESKTRSSVGRWNDDRAEEGRGRNVELRIIEPTKEMKDRAVKENKTPGRIYMEDRLMDEQKDEIKEERREELKEEPEETPKEELREELREEPEEELREEPKAESKEEPGDVKEPADNSADKPGNEGTLQKNNVPGDRQPSDGIQQPPTGMQQPTDGGQQPSNGMQQPQNGIQQPADESQQPSNDVQQPSNGMQQPSNSEQPQPSDEPQPHEQPQMPERSQPSGQPQMSEQSNRQ